MDVWLRQARKDFHADCLLGPISSTNGIPSIADVSNKASREISCALVKKIGLIQLKSEKLPGQTAGHMFEGVCQSFLKKCMEKFSHLRPGEFAVERGKMISMFDQYTHLDEIRILTDESKELKTHLGTDYLIKPDIVVIRKPETDDKINS